MTGESSTEQAHSRNPFESYHYFYDENGNDWGWCYDSDFEVAEVAEEEEEKA